MTDTPYLFVYGTLMRGLLLHGLIADRSSFMGEGTIAARLIDLGRYPGAIPDVDARLRGEVFRLDSPEIWRTLDSVEGPQYHRTRVPVEMGAPRLEAYVYWYHGPLDRGVPVPGGDWRAHAPARSIHRSSSL